MLMKATLATASKPQARKTKCMKLSKAVLYLLLEEMEEVRFAEAFEAMAISLMVCPPLIL
jgi:hypothetical protein